MPVVHANGLKLHAQLLGREGPAVCMLHGLLLGNLASWYFGAASRLAPDHRVLLYDLRGHGLSERARDGYDLPTMAGDLDALVARFVPGERLHLVGHSYGGLIALRWALDHPDSVDRLVLVDVPMPPSSAEEIEFCRRAFARPDVESLAALVVEQFGAGRRRALKFARQLCFLLNESTAVDDLQAEADFPEQALAAIDRPVLCVYGNQSACLPAGERLAEILPDARLETLEGGHFLPLDAPGPLAEAIRGFLA